MMYRFGALQLPVVLRDYFIGGRVGNGTAAGGISGQMLNRADVLLQPVTKKESASGGNHRLQYGFSCMQGWRRTMEDAHTMLPDYAAPMEEEANHENGGANGSKSNGNGVDKKNNVKFSFFAVFDGHCGSNIAKFCGSNMARFLSESKSFQRANYRDGLTEAYINIDKHLRASPQFQDERSGCTAVSVLISDTHMYCANAGDSRAVLCRDGRVLPLSFDHKPHLPQETRRIMKAGSFVFNRRVNGVLALSRAIGDFAFKQRPGLAWEEQAVTCLPDVQCVPFDANSKDEFVVVACDGIWDVLSNAEVVAFVRPKITAGMPLSIICEKLIDRCMSNEPIGLGCDNMSVIIISFNNNNNNNNITNNNGNSVNTHIVDNGSAENS